MKKVKKHEMTKVKKYKELKEKNEDLKPRLDALEDEITRLEEEIEPLEDKVIQYKIRGDSREAAARKELEKKQAKIPEKKEQLRLGRKEFKLRAAEMAELQVGAREEINTNYQKIFEPKVKEFVKVLKQAEVMEKELLEIREKGRKAMTNEIDASADAMKIPAWPVILLPSERTGRVPVIRDFIKFIERNSKIKFKSKKNMKGD